MARILFCLVLVNNCTCEQIECICEKAVVLIVECFKCTVGKPAAYDKYVELNLSDSMLKVYLSNTQHAVIAPDGIAGKCVCSWHQWHDICFKIANL